MPVAAFIGDSYTQGAGGAGITWTRLVTKSRGWQEVNLGRGGTGYHATNRGCGLDYCPTFAEMIPDAAAAKPAVVFVAGGRNDGKVYEDQIRTTFTALRASLPNAKIYAVEPLWDDGPMPEWLKAQAVAVNAAVKAVGGTYLAIGQPLHARAALVGPDGVHPNAAGYGAIAAAVVLKL